MKTKLLYILTFFASIQLSSAQNSLSQLLEQHNTNSIPYISVQELAMPKTQAIILDAREITEYNVSHLKNAIHIGYTNFKIDSIQKKISNKNQHLVVYCSLGIRSEVIAKKLKKAGYKNVFNLYGGIFEWKNNNFKVYNLEQKETEHIHAFSKHWSRWLTKGIKIYD